MADKGTVTQWFDEVEQGDRAAVQSLWERYFPELVRLAREKLCGTSRAVADEEDIALSVMDSFFDAAQQNRFPNLADRDDLWRLLIRMTARKVVDLKRRETRRRRGGGRVHNASSLPQPAGDAPQQTLSQVVGTTPTPEFAVMVAEEYRLRSGTIGGPDAPGHCDCQDAGLRESRNCPATELFGTHDRTPP